MNNRTKNLSLLKGFVKSFSTKVIRRNTAPFHSFLLSEKNGTPQEFKTSFARSISHNHQIGKLAMASSNSILSSLNYTTSDITPKARSLAHDVLNRAINDETTFLLRVREIYPEFSFYSGTVEGSPDGTTKVSGSEQEQRRTELSFLCLFWLLRGDYEKLTQAQPKESKLTLETFKRLQKSVMGLLHDEEAIDAMFATMAIHDLGKIVWFQNKVKAISKSTSVDHDEILLFALKICPDILPSYSRLSEKYQRIIRDAWNMHFNLGQFVQSENLPANLTHCINAARTNPNIIDYYFLHEILDLGGVTGHISMAGSQTLNELNIFAYQAAWDAIVNPDHPNETAAYDAYLAVRGQRLGLDAKNPEQRAAIRLCCNARMFESEQGQQVLEAFRSLPISCQTILKKELNVSGVDNEKGILLYYAPQTLVNLITNKSGREKFIALQRGFEVLARLYVESRIHLKGQQGNGVYTLLIAAVSDCAAKDPEMLKFKNIEIDPIIGKVTKITDRKLIQTDQFPSLKDLSELPGKRIVVVGIGGGSDGIQAKLIAELAAKSGKEVVGVVSVRTKYTQFASQGIPNGTEREILAPTATLGNDVYLLGKQSRGIRFDRYLEEAIADGESTYMLLDRMQPSHTDDENVEMLSQQFDMLFQKLKPDTVIGLDTGGDGLFPEVHDEKLTACKSTPDQDLRVIKALNKLDIPNLITMEVAVGVDSPENAQQVLSAAKASYFSLSDSEQDYLLSRYHELGMDAETAQNNRFGKTPFAWQQALIRKNEPGYYFLPIPAVRILDPKNPWNPVVCLEKAMQGIFVMNLRNHVAAICKPVKAEVLDDNRTNKASLQGKF